jgi:hypothetical protein
MLSANLSRRAIAWGLGLLAAAMVADLVEALVDPVNSGDGAKVVAAATQHHGRMVVAAILVLLSAAFIAPAIFGLVRLLKGRGRGVGRAAMVLAVLGTLGHAALGGIYLIWASMPADAGTHAELIAALDRANDSSSVAILAPLFIAFPLSLVTFFVATVRGGLAPRWLLAPVLAAPVVGIALGGSQTAGTVAALVLLLVAAAVLATRLLGSAEAPRARPEPALA